MRTILKATASSLVLVLLLSCGGNNNKNEELELKKKELDLKEKELQLRTDSLNNSKLSPAKPATETVTTPETSIEKLLGYWYMPGDESVNVRFMRDKTFVLQDYDASKNPETVSGTYELSGSTLTLLYDDRPKQSFKFYKGAGSRYYIENKGVMFVKGNM